MRMITSRKGAGMSSGGIWQRVFRQRQSYKAGLGGTPKKSAGFGVENRMGDAWLVTPGKPVWTSRRYDALAEEAYSRNVVAYRAISMVSQAASSVRWTLSDGKKRPATERQHQVLSLLQQPHPCMDGAALIDALVSYRLIGGNSYLLAVGPEKQPPLELHVLRPDRVQVLAGKHGGCVPAGYRYSHAKGHTDYAVSPSTGHCRVMHWKQFHPLDDWYGLSSVEPAAYSIDQHNQAGAWNQALLQHGARPSGALVVTPGENNPSGVLSEEQYQQLKQQIDSEFSGSGNAGRPLLLQGGLDWKEMSMSPKDMDFLDAKHSAARDIALAFGVPPQLLGIPGDNTYSNLKEARLALWEQTVLPLLDSLAGALSGWLLPFWEDGGEWRLVYDRDSISALAPKRDAYWERVNNATFLSDEEKKALLERYV